MKFDKVIFNNDLYYGDDQNKDNRILSWHEDELWFCLRSFEYKIYNDFIEVVDESINEISKLLMNNYKGKKHLNSIKKYILEFNSEYALINDYPKSHVELGDVVFSICEYIIKNVIE